MQIFHADRAIFKGLEVNKKKTPQNFTKEIYKNIGNRKQSEMKKKGRGRSMTSSETSKEPADLEKSRRKVIYNPRLENNFTFPQISLKNLLLSERADLYKLMAFS